MSNIKDEFNACVLTVKKNVLGGMNSYYADESEWEEESENLVKYSIFYGLVCSAWIKSIMFFQFEARPFAEKFLVPETNAELDRESFQNHHYGLIRNHYIDRSAVTLLLSNTIDKSNLTKASEYHNKHLKQYSYKDEQDLIESVDSETMLSTLMPQTMTCMLLGVDHSRVFDNLPPEVISKEKLWSRAWKLLYKINAKHGIKELNSSWAAVIKEWRMCFIDANSHGFSESNLVFLYHLYCKATGQEFDIQSLSREIQSI